MNALAELHLLHSFLFETDDLLYMSDNLVNELNKLYNVSEKEIYAVLNKWNFKFGILDYGVSMRCSWLATYDMDFGEKLMRVYLSIAQRLEVV
jgi:hypothetical protein